jgi:hypothetical protein
VPEPWGNATLISKLTVNKSLKYSNYVLNDEKQQDKVVSETAHA